MEEVERKLAEVQSQIKYLGIKMDLAWKEFYSLKCERRELMREERKLLLRQAEQLGMIRKVQKTEAEKSLKALLSRMDSEQLQKLLSCLE